MKKIFLYTLIALLMMPVALKAAGSDYTLLEPLPCIQGTGNGNCGSGPIPKINLDTYIGYIFKFSIALAAFLAVIMIIYAGFEYMLSESVIKKVDAKGKIINALGGLLMVLASYLILRTIDPRLVEVNTTIPKINIDTSSVKQFQSSLAQDLSQLVAEDGKKYADLKDKISKSQTRIDELNYKNSSEEGLTDSEFIELTELEQIIKSAKSDQAKILASGNGKIQFGSGLHIIHSMPLVPRIDENGPYYGNNGELNTKGVEELDGVKNKIKDYYGKGITDLVKYGAFTSALDLQKEQDFYLNQIEEEKVAYKLMTEYATGIGDKETIQNMLSKYQDQLKKADGVVTDPTLLIQYKQLLQGRIDRANSYINPPKK